MPRRLPFRLASLLIACGAASAHAAELGDVRVNSYRGQHLSADIELTALDDPATPVKVRLASIDVYRGANLDMPPVLGSLYMNVVRRDGKQFLHVTSTRPVEADHLHLYLEMTDGSHREVRLATLWFSPDPTPPEVVPLPPAPAPAPVPAPTPAAAQTAVVAASHRKMVPIRPLPENPAPRARISATPTVAAPALGPKPAVVTAAAALDANPAMTASAPALHAKPAVTTAAAALDPRPAVTTAAPALDAKPAAPAPALDAQAAVAMTGAARAETPATATAAPLAAATRASNGHASPTRAQTPTASPPAPRGPTLAGVPARPAPLKLANTASTLACRKQAMEAQSTCAALDNKNAELRAEIGKLEARVNTLLAQQNPGQSELSKHEEKQVSSPESPQQAQPGLSKTVQGQIKRAELFPAVARPGQTASGKVTPAGPLSHPAATPSSGSAKTATHASSTAPGMPWGWIAAAGVAVFAAIGAVQFWRHRRKRPKSATVHAPLPVEDEDVQVEPTLG